MRVALAPRFVREYGGLSKADQQLCDAAVEALPSAFGHPHHHAGLGLRGLRRGLYECRAGLALRIGFTRHGEILLLQTIGNHLSAWVEAVNDYLQRQYREIIQQQPSQKSSRNTSSSANGCCAPP